MCTPHPLLPSTSALQSRVLVRPASYPDCDVLGCQNAESSLNLQGDLLGRNGVTSSVHYPWKTDDINPITNLSSHLYSLPFHRVLTRDISYERESNAHDIDCSSLGAHPDVNDDVYFYFERRRVLNKGISFTDLCYH